jgi:hypothetical protein
MGCGVVSGNVYTHKRNYVKRPQWLKVCKDTFLDKTEEFRILYVVRWTYWTKKLDVKTTYIILSIR